MLFGYLDFARAAKNKENLEKTNPQKPVLDDENEEFLKKVASNTAPDSASPVERQDDASPTPPSGADADPAKPAPSSSTSIPEQSEPEPETQAAGGVATSPASSPTTKRTWASYVPSVPSIPVPSVSLPTWRSTASASASASDTNSEPASTNPPGVTITENVKLDEAKQAEDERDMSVLLDRLSFSSINNRVFSFSEQSQKIHAEFTLILKDMINGVPTAYQDMETLLRNNDAYLRETFAAMPPFVQTLVKSLPSKLGTTLGPEILAAASEKPGADMKSRMAAASSATDQGARKKSKKSKVPSVQNLANQKGAVAGMLRSTVGFLQARFPAIITGTNVIMSLAVFILMFVFYYCFKRGRETRLARQGVESAEGSVAGGSDTEGTLGDEDDLLEESKEAELGDEQKSQDSVAHLADQHEGIAAKDQAIEGGQVDDAVAQALKPPEPENVPLP